MLFLVGGRVAYLVSENGEEVTPCLWSLPVDEECSPSLLALVIPPVFQILCLSKGKKRQKSWGQASGSDSAAVDEADALDTSYFIVFSWVNI